MLNANRVKNLFLFLFLVVAFGCKKDPEVIPDNPTPPYNKVPTVLIENYVNRIFIDLIGREPLDAEMTKETKTMKDGNLDLADRQALISKLQTNTDYIEGDSSYHNAYYNRMYDLAKVRVIEGASAAEINQYLGIHISGMYIDSVSGDSLGVAEHRQEITKLQNVLDANNDYQYGNIDIVDVFAIMINNQVYDIINMNTFNYINATFDDLFFRFPTSAEFYQAFDMIEYNLSSNLLGQPGQNKGDYIEIVTTSREFHEGVIIWNYLTLLARTPTSAEVDAEMSYFYSTHDMQKLQENIMVTDEYANIE